MLQEFAHPIIFWGVRIKIFYINLISESIKSTMKLLNLSHNYR